MRAFAKSLAAGLVVALGLCSAPAQAFGEFDGGGRVADYLDLVTSTDASGGRLEISGVCASACTMKLGARGACVHSDAQLWFHAARFDDGGLNPLGNRILLRQYPERIRNWALSSGALTSLQFTTMSGAQAIAFGVPSCERTYARPVNYTPRPAPASICTGLISIWTGCATPSFAASTSIRFGRSSS